MNLSISLALFLVAVGAPARAVADRGLGGALYEHNGHSFESLQVMSYSGAHCILRRDEGVLADVTIPISERTAGVSQTIAIDVTNSKNPIVVSCKLTNNFEITRKFVFRPQMFYAEGPLCLSPPPKATAAQLAEASECQRRRFWSFTVTEYPETLRVSEPSSNSK